MRGASDALWRNADALKQANQTLSNVMSMGQMASAGSRQTLQPMGDLMASMTRQLEQLNRNVSQSPLLSGRPLAGGAAMSGGQAWASSFGLPVQVQGLRPGEVGAVSAEARGQLTSLAWQHAARSGLQDALPRMLGMGLALSGPWGALAAPFAAGGASLMMPSIMRSTGLDRELQRESITRDIQRSLGERLGVEGIGERFRVSRDRAGKLTQGALDFIEEQQKQYTVGGVFNFGLNAADYQPMINAAVNMNTTSGLKNMISKGGEGMKEQLKALIAASASLGATFEEVSELANIYGQSPGGAGQFAQFANQVERYAAAAGGGLDRRQLMGFALGVREQARGAGMSGEMAMQDVMSLTSTIQAAANDRLLSYNQLAGFGGNTEQERAQNMAAAVFSMQATMAQGPIGNMVRANLLAGGGAGAGMGGFGAFAGGAAAGFLNNPFGFINSMADPTMNSLVAGASPFAYINQLNAATRGFGPGAGRAAFIRQGGQFGLNAVQAGTTYDMFTSVQGKLSDKFKGREADIMGKALSYATQTGSTVFEIVNKLKDGSLSEDDLSAGLVLGGEEFTGTMLSAAQIEARAQAAADTAAAENTYEIAKKGDTALQKVVGGYLGFASTGGLAGIFREGGTDGLVEFIRGVGGVFGAAGQRIHDPEGAERVAKIKEQVAARLTAQNQKAYISDKLRGAATNKNTLFSLAGLSLEDLNDPKATAASLLSKFKGEAFNYSKEFSDLVRTGGGALDADMLQKVITAGGAESEVLRTTLNAALKNADTSILDEFKDIAGDRKIDAAEMKSSNLRGLMNALNKNGSLMMSVFGNAVLKRESMFDLPSQIGSSVASALSKTVLTVKGA